MSRISGLASQVNWLFLTADHIRRAREIIKAAGPESTFDVLGLGNPIEKISDLYFPGTSTLHTELRYVIFTPAILYAMQENKGVSDAFGFLKRKEVELLNSLLRGGIDIGVIGRTKGEALKYWPSTTYWTAINTFKILGPVDYDRVDVLQKLSVNTSTIITSDDGDSTGQSQLAFKEDSEFKKIAMSLFVKKNQKDRTHVRWPDKLDFNLRKCEANYLRNKILDLHPLSLYVELFRYSQKALNEVQTIFDLKVARKELESLIQESAHYSKFAMGVTLAYRWALCKHLARARKAKEKESNWLSSAEKNKELFKEWLKNVKTFRNWQIMLFSKARNEAFPAAQQGELFDKQFSLFCDEAVDVLLEGRTTIEGKLERLGQLVRKREYALKKNRSRFCDESMVIPENVRPAEDVKLQPHLYEYRWSWGKKNASTILDGLKKK